MYWEELSRLIQTVSFVWIADVLMDVANDVDKGAKIVVLGDDGT